jgi:eukaryotic-like serine/threonine-protein kinase
MHAGRLVMRSLLPSPADEEHVSELLERLSKALAASHRIERELGHGGMAVVFLARDLRHDRPVAIKVLRPELAAILGSERFLREIRLVANLTHPHILPLLDSGEAGGLLYYTMPFIEGETLRLRLAREGQLPLGDGLRIAGEVADALDYAHRQGVVHRDIKPENILLAAGHAVVADFGIAYALEAAGGPRLTTTGVILGTPAYLSPEQAAGSRALDARTDQYSLGCVVYEMLAGQPPFTGPTAESLVHQHLSAAPRAVTDLRPAMPAALAATLARALAKNPADRFETTARFTDALASAAAGVAAADPAGRPEATASFATTQGATAARAVPAPPPAGAASRRRPVLLWPAAGVVLVAAVAIGLWASLRAHGTTELQLSRMTYDTGLTEDPAISRDGKLLAYASDRAGDGNVDIWVQYVGQRSPLRLTHDPAIESYPFFSPDGSRLAFRSERGGGGIYVVNTLGGPERKIVDGGTVPRFSPDGSSIAFVEDVPWAPGGARRMFVVPQDGGAPRPLAPDFVTSAPPTNGGPIWSPDGRRLMFFGGRPGQRDTWDWWVVPADGGEAVRTGAVERIGRKDVVQFPCIWLPRQLIFLRGTTIEGMNLYRASIDPKSFRVSGPVEPLTSGPGMKYAFSASDGGTIVLPDLTWVIQIWEAGLAPASGLTRQEPVRITSDAAPKFGLFASHDGTRLAYSSYSGPGRLGQTEVRVRDLVSGDETSLATSVSSDRLDLVPVLGDRGAFLAYQDDISGHATALIQRAGATAARELCRDCGVMGLLPASGDALIGYGRQRLARRNLSTGAERDLVRLGTGSILDADPADGDRWLAVLWGKPDRTMGLYAVPVRDSAASERNFIPLAEWPCWFGSPRWSSDGSRLYFLSNRDGFVCVWMQRVDRSSGGPVGPAVAVLHSHRADRLMGGPSSVWAIAVAGDRLFFNAAEARGNIWAARMSAR